MGTSFEALFGVALQPGTWDMLVLMGAFVGIMSVFVAFMMRQQRFFDDSLICRAALTNACRELYLILRDVRDPELMPPDGWMMIARTETLFMERAAAVRGCYEKGIKDEFGMKAVNDALFRLRVRSLLSAPIAKEGSESDAT